MRFHRQFIYRTPLVACGQTIEDAVFAEALYLSSPVLYAEYQKNLQSPLKDPKELKKLNISLYKYKSRASQRCTPFGLFAGLSVGSWSERNSVVLDADLKATLKRKTRLDMNVLCSLAQEVARQNYISPYLIFSPNTSIYLVGENYRYIEYYYRNNKRVHKINKVDHSEPLALLLEESKKGLTKMQLSELLVKQGIEPSEADAFIQEVISAQLLVHQFEPSVTGQDYFEVLINHLKIISESNPDTQLAQLIGLLKEQERLIQLNDRSVFNPIAAYRTIHKNLTAVLPGLSETNLFQTDLFKVAATAELTNTIQDQLRESIAFLNRITPPGKNALLEDFKKRFSERYEEDEVPLLVALDTETGIGFPSKNTGGVNELVEDLFVANYSNESEIKWNPLQAHLLKLITNSIKENKRVVSVSEEDFQNVDFSSDDLPDTYPVMFRVLNASTNKLELGTVGGSSAANLLGRFAGNEETVYELIKEIARYEQSQYTDKVLAEIAHLPESRTGNILSRPAFRAFEIPYLAKSSVGNEFQIKMEDLTVRVKNNRIILFDKRLGKEIIPRMGNAHNYSSNSLPVYHFLCSLQAQYFSKIGVGFNWGVLAGQFRFLPRVEFKNVVLSAARWQLNRAQLAALQEKAITDTERVKRFFELKKSIDLPGIFLMTEGDNELLIDCNDPVAIDTFLDAVRKRHEVILEEYLFEEEHPLVKDTNGNGFTNECLAIVFTENKNRQTAEIPVHKVYRTRQVFATGSEWLYYKIYCGAKTADLILTQKLKPLADQLLREGVIDKWFFIRYWDTDTHLRFRLHILDFSRMAEIMQLMNAEMEVLMGQHLVAKLHTDTYRRELDRYGDNSMEMVEHLFFYDSIFVAEMLSLLDPESGGTLRWQLALRSVDQLLNDFRLRAEEKYELTEQLSLSFFKEHGGKKELKLQLDDKFRALRPQVEEIMNKEGDPGKEYYPLIEALSRRTENNKRVVPAILSLYTSGALHCSLNELLASLLHMHLNRLFMGRNRTNEFVVYDLLARYYKSAMARARKNQPQQVLSGS